jgi:hypothetical protein
MKRREGWELAAGWKSKGEGQSATVLARLPLIFRGLRTLGGGSEHNI